MTDVAKRDGTDVVKKDDKEKNVSPSDFDRAFDHWWQSFSPRRFWSYLPELPEEGIKVDEYHDGDTLVIRAELPGIDPEKDVELTVDDGYIHIQAHRRQEENKTTEKGFRRREIRYGSFSRSLPLPRGVKDSDITATYNNGILEIKIPTPKSSATKVPIAKK